MDRKEWLDQMAAILEAAGATVTWPEVEPEPIVLPADDAPAEEVAEFIFEHFHWLEDARNIGVLDDDELRYLIAWKLLEGSPREPSRLKPMLEKWTSEQLRKHRASTQLSWNSTPSKHLDLVLNKLRKEILEERHGKTKVPETSGMDETSGEQRR